MVPGNPWSFLASGSSLPKTTSIFTCLSPLCSVFSSSYKDTSIGLTATLNPGPSHLKICNLSTSAKISKSSDILRSMILGDTIQPTTVIFADSRGLDIEISFRGPLFHLLQI